ncbi:MAG: hypothetical protein ACRETX_01295, partial [Steroidobacteraceae bacterium]
ALIRRWLAQSESQHELEAFGGADHVRRVEEQTTAHLEQSRRQASRLFEAFVQRLGWRRSHRRLGSR